GNDVLLGGAGNDRFYIGTSSGVDNIDGGDGFDVIQAAADNAVLRLSGISGIERINGNGFANFVILGGSAADFMDFSAIQLLQVAIIDSGGGNDTVIGSAGADNLFGNSGSDSLVGGGGADRLTGGVGLGNPGSGAGGGRFIYASALESRTGSLADRIADFTPGSDRIDLSALDADSATEGDQALAFIGSTPFVASGIGQVRVISAGVDSLIQVDLDGNGLAEMEIRLTGAPVLTAVDFVL
ncbi:MAG TPA: M10 family metallopeptidase C-terminal domain-containing protein, partial [Novosphingobium sp.]|nr:M10 family metallopeptidase C-terminal domain-containing protein [Novosphingobium sp.]